MKKTLYRSRENKVFGGVAGGLAEYFNVDPVIIRILFVVVFFAGGVSFIAYIVMMFIIPKKPYDIISNDEEAYSQNNKFEKSFSKSQNKITFGIFLIIVGLFAFLSNFIPYFSFHLFWPLLLIIFGVLLIYRNFMNSDENEAKNEI